MSSTKVLFSALEDEILVEMVAKYPCLFKLACDTYKNQMIKDNTWKEVAEAVARSVDHCKKRWRNIKDTYQKRQKKLDTGSAASSKPSKWALSESLSFLAKTNYQRQSTSNIETTDNASPEIELVDANEDEAEESDSVHPFMKNKQTAARKMHRRQRAAIKRFPKCPPHLLAPNVNDAANLWDIWEKGEMRGWKCSKA